MGLGITICFSFILPLFTTLHLPIYFRFDWNCLISGSLKILARLLYFWNENAKVQTNLIWTANTLRSQILKKNKIDVPNINLSLSQDSGGIEPATLTSQISLAGIPTFATWWPARRPIGSGSDPGVHEAGAAQVGGGLDQTGSQAGNFAPARAWKMAPATRHGHSAT